MPPKHLKEPIKICKLYLGSLCDKSAPPSVKEKDLTTVAKHFDIDQSNSDQNPLYLSQIPSKSPVWPAKLLSKIPCMAS